MEKLVFTTHEIAIKNLIEKYLKPFCVAESEFAVINTPSTFILMYEVITPSTRIEFRIQNHGNAFDYYIDNESSQRHTTLDQAVVYGISRILNQMVEIDRSNMIELGTW